MEQKSPLVSVVIPYYNAQQYIFSTLESVLSQTYQTIEIILVDDGSTDHGVAKVKQKFKDKIQHIHQNNQGVSVARNTGIAHAKGMYVAFLDADDVWREDNIEKKVALLEAKKHIDFAFSNMRIINERGAFLREAPVGTDQNMHRHVLLWDRSVVGGPGSNLVVKASDLNRHSILFDPQFSTAADQDFVLQLTRQLNGGLVDDFLIDYRDVSQSMSKNIRVMQKDHIGVFKKHLKTIEHSYSKTFIKQCFSNLYLILAGSWWKDGRSKPKGVYFLLKSLLSYPPQIFSMVQKFFRKLFLF